MTSRTVDNVGLPQYRDHSSPDPALERRGDVNVDHGLRYLDVGWPLLRLGNHSSWFSSLRYEAIPQDGRCAEAMPSNARTDSLEDAKKSSGAVESLDFLARGEEPVQRQPPFAFLKPCRQFEKHYSANRRSIAAQLASLKSRLEQRCSDRLAENDSFRHSHNKITAKETTSKEKKEDVHELRHFQSVDEPTECPTSGHVPRNLAEKSCCGISSTKCSLHEKEAHIAPAAANFEVETFDLPSYAPASNNAVAIPFKWEDAPGKAKVSTEARRPHPLQLPPRLAVPSHCISESPPGELEAPDFSHPLAGFFAPCLAASSPVRHQRSRSWVHYQASKSLPPTQSQPYLGYGGNQDMLSKSGDTCSSRRELSKSFSQLLTTTESLSPNPRSLFCSKPKDWHTSMQQGSHDHSAAPSSLITILHGSRRSSSSRTYLSCEMDASTPRTAEFKSSSSVSYESIGEDFDCNESTPNPNSCINKSHSFHSHTSAGYSETLAMQSSGRRSHVKLCLLKLCKGHGKRVEKFKEPDAAGCEITS